jgi:hypothetical protein
MDGHATVEFTQAYGGSSKAIGGHKMRKYCKAYYIKDLRQFNGWTERLEENEPALADDDIGYIWDDFTVVKSPILSKSAIFDDVTPAWQNFCRNVLQFEIPEDLRYAYAHPEEQASETEAISSAFE